MLVVLRGDIRVLGRSKGIVEMIRVGSDGHIGRDGHMIQIPGKLRHVIGELEEFLHRRPVGSTGTHAERTPGHQGDDSTPGHTSPDLVVVDVSRVRNDGVGVRVAEHAGVSAAVHDLQGRPLARVAAVQNDPGTIAFVHHPLAETGQPPVGPVQAPVGQLVRGVVHQ
jgi:hypothetical protein